jgi:hypothetical protein
MAALRNGWMESNREQTEGSRTGRFISELLDVYLAGLDEIVRMR